MPEVVLRKSDHVTRPLAQRWHFDRDNIKPKIEVFANAPSTDALLRSWLRSGNDAHLGLTGDIFADPLVFTLLSSRSNLGWDLHRQVTDLIEEEGPPRQP